MKIETKLDMWDNAFFISENKVGYAQVICIDFRCSKGGLGTIKTVEYKLSGLEGFFNESEVHATKQDLLDSL